MPVTFTMLVANVVRALSWPSKHLFHAAQHSITCILCHVRTPSKRILVPSNEVCTVLMYDHALPMSCSADAVSLLQGYPVHAGTPVQITTQLWTRLTEAQQGQFSEMAESIRSVFDELTKHPDAQVSDTFASRPVVL